MSKRGDHDGLFENLLRTSQPVKLGPYVKLTLLFYGIAIILLFALLGAGVEPALALLVILVPIALAWVTIARRFTALGWNPVWMLVAWPLATVLWIVLMLLPADIDRNV